MDVQQEESVTNQNSSRQFGPVKPILIVENPNFFLFKEGFHGEFLQRFLEWQSPTMMSPEQPPVVTIKEKPSHYPKREIKAQQIHFE